MVEHEDLRHHICQPQRGIQKLTPKNSGNRLEYRDTRKRKKGVAGHWREKYNKSA